MLDILSIYFECIKSFTCRSHLPIRRFEVCSELTATSLKLDWKLTGVT